MKVKRQVKTEAKATRKHQANENTIASHGILNANPDNKFTSQKTSIRFSRLSKFNVKPSNIDGFTQRYVGLRPPDFRTPADLKHLENFMEAHAGPTRAESILENLDYLLRKIPSEKYNDAGPAEKLEIIQKLNDAYTFAWNEACEQLYKISKEHAEVFVKIKKFFVFLIEEYPQVLKEYQNQIDVLKDDVSEKQQHLDVLTNELQSYSEKEIEASKFIASLRDEIKHIKKRKKYFKQGVNKVVLQNEKLQDEITELRCDISKLKENFKEQMRLNEVNFDHIFESTHDFIATPQPKIEMVDIGTDALELHYTPVAKVVQKDKIKATIIEEEEPDLPFDFSKPFDKNSGLRHILYGFMIEKPVEFSPQMKVDLNPEMKKFCWVFPKILSLFLSGFQFEDS